jgi:hypothetical protein
MNIRHKLILKLGVLLALPLFAACGGGGSDGSTSPPPPPAPTFADGVFVDSAVEGLTYQSGSNASGTTDANGTFTYEEGVSITFSLGGITLGTLPDGKALVSPYDFGAQQAENIARLLQTLDADGNHANGINLTAAATALSGTTLDASTFDTDAATFETAITPALETALGAGTTLIDAATAIANLDAALDTTFDIDEVAGAVFVVDVPSDSDIGIAAFDLLADPADTGSSVELFMQSDTLAEGGFGTTTVLDWSVDAQGVITLTDPGDGQSLTITRTGGSIGLISIAITDGVDTINGSFLIPASGTEMDLTGNNDRTYILDDTSGIAQLTFFDTGRATRLLNDVVAVEDWTLTNKGSLITAQDSNLVVHLTVVLNGNLVLGGDTITVRASNISGDPLVLDLQLEELSTGTLAPVTLPDPSTAVGFTFTTGVANGASDPNLLATFTGATVSGSFRYANWVPPAFVLPGPTLPGATGYLGAMLDLAGTVNGMSFSDPTGIAISGNERYQTLGGTDFFMLTASSMESGFDVGGYTLVNARWFQIETDTTGNDFLDSDLLPTNYPNEVGRLALDFNPPGDPDTTVSVFFDGFVATPSP